MVRMGVRKKITVDIVCLHVVVVSMFVNLENERKEK